MNKLLKGSQRFLKKNSATILTCVGAAGVVVTAVTTAKAAVKADALLKEAEEYKGEELTFDEKLRLAAPIYIPAALTGMATITCIFGANILNKRTQTSLIGAYTMLDQSYQRYKNKVMDIYGEEASSLIAEEMAKDNYKDNDISKVSPNTELFYDLYSDRYFENTLENVLKAENELNKMLSTGWGAGINDFYKMIGLEELPEFGDLGWNTMQMEEMYWHAWIEFDHNKAVLDDGLECIIIDIPLEPIVDYLNY